jgi:CHAT domain-containing protein/SIR2-like protein
MSRPREPEVSSFLRLRLSLSPNLRDLPWECFYVSELGGALAGKPGVVIVRDPPLSGFFVKRDGAAKELRILVAVPQGSGLNSQQERNNLQRHAGPDAHVEEFLGQVTPDALASKLKNQWDIFHFLGHGMRDSLGHIRVLLSENEGGEAWIRDETIADLFTRDDLRLAILNCCMGDRHRIGRTLSGLGPLLALRGIPSVIAMRYEIADDDAITFSEALYRELLRGPFPGRIDWAVAAARAALSRNAAEDGQRAVITPVIYLAPGYEQLFEIELAVKAPVAKPASIAASSGSAALPMEVERAIKEGCCVPIIGPAALGWTRDHVLSPLVFARDLAQDKSCVYPLLQADLDLCERAGEWLNGHFLQWVCQHRESQNETRSELVELVQAHYAGAAPPPHVASFCRWKVPALFYTYFDGFLEAEVTHGNAWLNQVIYDLDKSLESTSPTLEGKRFLILLRGSHRRGKSLVLTETDHDALADKIGELAPQIAEFTLKERRLTLFLGVSPRDPLIRRLARRLLATQQRLHRPPYFVWKGWSSVDKAYWQQFGVRPIEEDASTVVRLIDRLMA